MDHLTEVHTQKVLRRIEESKQRWSEIQSKWIASDGMALLYSMFMSKSVVGVDILSINQEATLLSHGLARHGPNSHDCLL